MGRPGRHLENLPPAMLELTNLDAFASLSRLGVLSYGDANSPGGYIDAVRNQQRRRRVLRGDRGAGAGGDHDVDAGDAHYWRGGERPPEPCSCASREGAKSRRRKSYGNGRRGAFCHRGGTQGYHLHRDIGPGLLESVTRCCSREHCRIVGCGSRGRSQPRLSTGGVRFDEGFSRGPRRRRSAGNRAQVSRAAGTCACQAVVDVPSPHGSSPGSAHKLWGGAVQGWR